LEIALDTPKTTMKERIAVVETIPNFVEAN
jgi:hypothetical protein